MKILTCPINGPRPIQEFQFGGEVRESPDPATCTDAEWAAYVFDRAGEPGIKREWWYHVASNTWFIAERNVVTDEIIRTCLWKDLGV